MKRFNCVVAAAVLGILGASGAANATPIAIATTTSLAGSPNPAYNTWPDSSITFTASVMALGDPVNVGYVSFYVGTSLISGCITQWVSAGTAECSTAFPVVGTYDISAAYTGNVDYAASTGYAVEFVKSHSAPAPVPLPGSLTMFLPALAILAGLGLSARRSKAA